jgi:hypothetical protein
MLPITGDGDSSEQSVVAAAEAANGDVVVQVLATIRNRITFSGPGDYGSWIDPETVNYADGLARFTPSGSLVWGRDVAQMLASTSSQPVIVPHSGLCPFALASNGDIVLVYDRSNPPPNGPVMQTDQYRLGRIDSNDPSLIWEATVPIDYDVCNVVPRAAKNDFVVFGSAPDMYYGVTGSVFEIPNGGATAHFLAPNWSFGQVVGKDGATIWEWTDYYGGAAQLNPWSSTTWNIGGNPSMAGGYDAAIIGVQDGASPTISGSGTQIGPWISEGDYGPTYQMIVDSNGDLIVSVTSGGITRINGGMSLLSGAGNALVKLSGTTGSVLWQKDIPAQTTRLSMAPGGRIVTLADVENPATGGSGDTGKPYVLSLYSDADGSLLTSFSAGSAAFQIASGANDIYVVGMSTSAADFNPGSASDPSEPPCIFISRYTF